jgi:hypothetical protein
VILIREVLVVWQRWEWIQERQKGGLVIVSLKPLSMSARNLTFDGSCTAKGRIFKIGKTQLLNILYWW